MQLAETNKLPQGPEALERARWSQRIFAWMLARRSTRYEKAVAARKRALLGNLQGHVLEIGPGAGVNLVYYPSGIRWIGIEPNPYLHPYLKKEAEKRGLHADLHRRIAERLGVADCSADAVVGTLVLCSVRDVVATLREILRVLKPGGQFVFIDHVAAPRGTWLRRAQSWIQPIWRIVADGCCADRETSIAIENAGFAEVKLEYFRAPALIVAPHIGGVATKKAD